MSLVLKLVLSPLLVAQAMHTRRRAPVLPEAAGARRGRVGAVGAVGGSGADATPLRLLIVGDSSAAGVGVRTQQQALAGQLSRPLAKALGRTVRWQLVAKTGITTPQALALLHERQAANGLLPADIAVVVLGVNDVVAQVPSHRAITQRAELADWLLAHSGVRHVVFAPLPPMHRFPLLPQPLRWVIGSDARRHDAALSRWAATRRDVSHAPFEMPLDAASMASDGFHPGEPVYRACGEALARFIAENPHTTTTQETT